MHFEEEGIYHIFNRSNEQVFFERNNYIFFLRKIKSLVKTECELLAWCLMPNHFHMLVQATASSAQNVNERHRRATQRLAKNLGTLASAYTSAINKKRERRGKLWAHSTRAKPIRSQKYATLCFHYIHQNPVMAGLTDKMEDWEFSSYPDYIGQRPGKLVNQDLAFRILSIEKSIIQEQSQIVLEEKDVRRFY